MIFLSFLASAAITFCFLAVLTLLLYNVRSIAESCSKGYGLDLVIALYSAASPIAMALLWGWSGLVGAIVGAYAFLYAFCAVHETMRPVKGQTINGLINSRIGFARNQIALLVTALAFPVFLQIRIAEIFLYPFLVHLVRFPAYKQNDWVNVSRQKHKGLVGSDLIWCLYCDWMTGVYSLGAEMLRNVESFWCPVRFASPQKCANCRVDFPDLDSWAVPEKGNVQNVVALMREKYFSGGRKSWSWFGHPERKLEPKNGPPPRKRPRRTSTHR